MCTQPIKIQNPNYLSDFYVYESGKVRRASKRLLNTNPFIEVPCGKCEMCRKSLYSSYLQRIQMESKSSYVFMITLTYDDKHIPYLSFNTDFDSLNVYYSDIKHVQLMFKRLRKLEPFNQREFRYFAVTEYGTEKFRPHHHILLFMSRKYGDDKYTPKFLEQQLWQIVKDNWCINVGSNRLPIYEPLFTYHSKIVNGKLYSNYDLRLVHDQDILDYSDSSLDSVAKASKYLISYLLKPNAYESKLLNSFDSIRDFMPSDLYRKMKSLLSCRTYYSKHLGFGFDISNSTKVIPSRNYQRANPFTVEMWRIYHSLPSTLIEFFDIYDSSCYYGLIDSFKRGVRTGGNFADLFSKVSPYELIFYCAILKYERYIFDCLIHRYNMDVDTFSITMLPLKPFDESFKSFDVYQDIRKMVFESHNLRLPYIGFRYEENGKAKYVPLCSYYKKYCCYEQDYLNWLDRLGVYSLSDIDYKPASLTSQVRVSSYNTGCSTMHLQSTLNNPYKKNKAQNLEDIDKVNIFVPTTNTLSIIYEKGA